MTPDPLPIELCPLPGCLQHRRAVAGLIHHEFWTAVPGASVDGMEARLAEVADLDRLPLCLVALHAGAPVGVVNLIVADEPNPVQWSPWLAGMVVAAPYRGRGVGSALVNGLLAEARRLGIGAVYLGTDGPGFYARLGAVVHQQPRPDFWFMRFDLR